MDLERRPELEAESTDELAIEPAGEAHDHGHGTSFTQHGEIPAVQTGESIPAAPSPSEIAYKSGKGGGKGKGKATAPDPAGPVLTAPVSRTVAGVKIIAPVGTHATAIDKVAEVVQLEVGKNELAQRKFAESRTTIVIIPATSKMTDVPQFQSMQGKQTFDGRDWSKVRGSGGVQTADGSFAIGVAEENLIEVRGVVSGYHKNYSIAMHELAHALQTKGMTPDQRKRLTELYNAQKRDDRRDRTTHHDAFTDDYAAANEQEYFAQSTNAFFGRNSGKVKGPDTPANGPKVENNNGRYWLYTHDPDMYAFLVDLYDKRHDAQGKTVNDGPSH